MTFDLLLLNVAVLGEEPTNIGVRRGSIAYIGPDAGEASQTIDAQGNIGLPGLVDIHVHLRQPGREDAETIRTGSAAAAAGGFAAICAMANTNPVIDTAELAEFVYDEGQKVGLTHVQPIGAVTKGLAGEQLAELGLMARSRANVRLFSDDGHCVADSQVMRRALEYIKPFGGVISQHSQDPRLAPHSSCCHEGEISGKLGLPGWPTVAEEVIVARDILLAEHTGSAIHVAHLTSPTSVDLVRWAKQRGANVSCEVTPHHLMLPTDVLTSYDPVYKVNPPLRPRGVIDDLRAGLTDGTVDAIATDHAPHAPHDKQHTFEAAAFGMLGLETSLAVIHSIFVREGSLGWGDVVRVMSTRPAEIARLNDRFGRPIAVGEPAHITLFDPQTTWVVDEQASESLSKNNPWHGRELHGKVSTTIFDGRVVFHDGTVTPKENA